MSHRPERVRWRSAALDADSALGPWARLAACALAEYASTGRCWPSIPTLARRMASSERKAHDAVSELERKGFLVVERRSGLVNHYELDLPLHVVHGSGTATAARTPARTPARRAAEPDKQITREPPPGELGLAQWQVIADEPGQPIPNETLRWLKAKGIDVSGLVREIEKRRPAAGGSS